MGISNLQLYIVLFEHLFSAMLVYSLERVFTIHDRKTAEKYLASEARGKKYSQRFLFLVKQKKGWIGIAVFAFLILATPFGFHFNLFYRAKEFLAGTFMKWIIGFETPVTLGLLLLACFWGRLTGLRYLETLAADGSMKGKEKSEKVHKVKWLIGQVLLIVWLYGMFENYLFNLILPVIVEVVVTVAKVLWIIGKYILAAIVLLYLVLLVRAMFKRRKFLKKFGKLCKEKGIGVPEYNHVYLSAIRLRKGENFRFTVDGKTYSCKFLSGSRKWVPMYFWENGEAGYLHRLRLRTWTIFSFVTHFQFGYEADCRKIVILSPVPSNVFLSGDGKVTPADNGDRAGEYTIYSANAFLNTFERGTLEYKPKEYDPFKKFE